MKTLLDYGDEVFYKGNHYTVVGKRWHQSRHMRRDAYMTGYSLEPVEYAGMEHDEEIWVSEADIFSTKE